MLLLCNYNNITLENLDKDTFSSIQEGTVPIEDIVDNAYYSKHRKEAKWYTDIREKITSDNIHLYHNITHLFGAYVNNVDDTRSYNVDKKNRSLIAFYNPQFDSVIIGKIQGIDEFQRIIRYLIPLLSASQYSLLEPHNIINYNIFDIYDFAKKKYYLLQSTLMQNHVISPTLQDNIILDLLDSSTSRNDLLRIQRTLALFENNNYHLFEFYTDGSLIDLEFYTTIDKWPSAYRGELLAVILALSVVPPNSRIMIKTDSLNVITQYEKMKKSHFTQTSGEYFKTNNNFLWAILCRVILSLNLNVEMFKVAAHSTDEHDAVKMKYRQLEVDWMSTFQCLNCDIVDNETSVFSSKIKAQKVHLLIEEIPTIEQMKKSFFDLYDE
ncbi:hypothetical protein C1646_755262 [Rhizophagus diaphanus]|nr:hypothetical protein C1646_755262 [Rhizophagus diaphanus] [Rhizophagus sp. MUCL 43196]